MGNVTVTPGILPNDGELVIPSKFLPEYVRTSEFTDIPSSAFKYGNLSFVSSQTDPPASAERGRIWFERGSGKLYINETFDRGGTAYSSGLPLFVQMAPGREMLVLMEHGTFPTKTLVRPDTATHRANYYWNQYLQTPRMMNESIGAAPTSYSAGGGQWPLATLIATTTVTADYPSSDYYVVRALERGRCQAKGNEESAFRVGVPVWLSYINGETTYMDGGQFTDPTRRLVGWAMEYLDLGSAEFADVEIYKVPTSDRFQQTDVTL